MTQAANFDFFYDLAIDEDKSENGGVFTFNGVNFKIAYADRPTFRAAAAKAWRKLLGDKTMEEAYSDSDEDQKRQAQDIKAIATETVAQTIILGWEGEINFAGEKLAYSVENAKKLLEVGAFRRWVDKISNEETNFRVARPTEADQKN